MGERTARLLRLVQACDPTFPVGAFNHSYGMETYLREGRVRDAAGFERWLLAYLAGPFAYGEGLACALAFRALDAGDVRLVWNLDRELRASTCAAETRRASRLVGRQAAGLLADVLGGGALLARYRELVAGGELHGSAALAFCLFAHNEGCSAEEAFSLWGYGVCSTLVQNAVRAVPLGQRAGQEVLARATVTLGELWPQVAACDPGLLGAASPGLELAQILHETQGMRLFMS